MSESEKSNKHVTAGFGAKLKKTEMKQQLEDLGLLEDDMTMDQMMTVLRAVQESQEISLQSVQNTIETMPQSLEASISPSLSPVAQISYSRVVSSNLSATLEKKSLSPELQSNQCSVKNHSWEKQVVSPEDNICVDSARSQFDIEPRESQGTNANRTRTGNFDNFLQTLTNDNKRVNNKGSHNTRREEKNRLKIDTLDMSVKRDDIALESRYRSDNEDFQEGSASKQNDNIEKAITQLSKHMHQIAEISHNHQRCLVDTNFQWGSAIKVGTANGSLNRKIIEEEFTTREPYENVDPEKILTNVANVTTRRRRACTTTKSAIYDYSDNDSEYNDKIKKDSDDDFHIETKRKKTDDEWQPDTVTRSLRPKSVEPVTESDTKTKISIEESKDNANVDLPDDIIKMDDIKSSQPPKKLTRSAAARISRALYPRKIEPPKPAHQRWASFKRARPTNGNGTKSIEEDDNEKSDNVTSTMHKSHNNSRMGLKETEIADELEKMENDNDDDDNNKTDLTPICGFEIRPLRISSRIKLAYQNLTQVRESEQEQENIRREKEKEKIEGEDQEKRERVRKRIQEQNQRMKQREEVRKAQKQRDENWKAISAQRDKGKTVERTELHPDGRPQNINNHVAESHDGDDYSTTTENMVDFIEGNICGVDAVIDHVPCPICNRIFPAKAIEAHAGACEEFETAITPNPSPTNASCMSPESTNNSSQNHLDNETSSLLRCQVCHNFSTYNGQEYGIHVNECIHRRRYGSANTSDIIEVSTSPLRTLRTISQLTDSEIDYKDQFGARSKPTKNPTRKRKR